MAYNDIGASIDGGDGNDHIVVQRFSAENINNIIGGVSWFAVSNILQTKLFKLGKKFAGSIKDTLLSAGLDNVENILSLKSFLDPLKGLNNNWDLVSPTSTVKGGKGNDTAYSGKNTNNMYFYTKGDDNDIIFSFDDNDTLTFDNLDFTSSYKNNVLALKVDGGSVTLKEFTSMTFHINDDTYQISGSKLVKKILTAKLPSNT